MIDELVKAANAIEKAGIKSQDWHPRLKVLPKVTKNTPCVRVWLTAGGHIHDIEPLAEELGAQLRKYEPDNGKSLPGFNVRPLYRLLKTKDEIKKASRGTAGEKLKIEWTKDFLNRAPIEQASNNFWEKTREGLKQSFNRVREELEILCNNSLVEGETLQKLFKVVSQIDVGHFQKEYDEKLRQKITDGTLPVTLMCYFVDDEKKKKEDSNSRVSVPKFSLFLDILDYTDYSVAHEKTIARLNDILCNTLPNPAVSDSSKQNAAQDAYGLDADALNEKFPEVALPILGGVKLRSQVKAVPAQSRYHLCEAQTFHVGSESRKRTKRALELLSNPERNGETYGVAGDKELLFAYPRVLPKDKIPLAKLFGAQKDDSYQKEDKFDRLAKSVIEQLRGQGNAFFDAQLEIFSLRKMDKARTKVVYYRNTTVESLEEASAAWHEGCQNIPLLGLKDWSEKKSEKTGKSHPVALVNQTVFPVKLHRYLNKVWKRDGDQAGKVKIFEPTDGLRLLLEGQNEGLVKHMMERFIQHAQGYFLTLCRSRGKDEIASLPDKKIYPGILGLLLCKLGKNKEDFMKESAFLLGRCLRITDEIHRLYCEVVRKKDLPPELCGGSLLVSMMESPVTTMSQLAMRSAPYIKWARGGGEKGDKSGLVWYWLKQWEVTADQLHTLTWPKRLIPEERAQIFLGYLASFPKSEKPNDNQTVSGNTTKEGDKK
jgi:hypothetical protein